MVAGGGGDPNGVRLEVTGATNGADFADWRGGFGGGANVSKGKCDRIQ